MVRVPDEGFWRDRGVWIKIVIIAALLAIMAVMLRTRGSRNLAIRRLTMVVFVLAAALSVVFPDVWSKMASFLDG